MKKLFCFASILLSGVSLFSCAVFYPSPCPTHEYVAVETPHDEIVILDGDTLRYGTTPEDILAGLNCKKTQLNLDQFSRVIYELNLPRTVYGVYEESPGNGILEIYAPDTTLVFDLCNLRQGATSGVSKCLRKNRVRSPDLFYGRDGYRADQKIGYFPRRHRPVVLRRRYEGSFLKGRLNVSLSLPWTQFYSILPPARGVRRYAHGFIGIGAGVEYLYRDKTGLALEWNGMLNIFIPVLAPLDIEYSGPYEGSSAMALSLAEYRHFRRFTLGYGINFTRNSWGYNYNDEPLEEGGEVPPPTFGTESLYEQYWSAGVVASAYVNLTPKIIFGVTYRPTFYRFTLPRKFCYEHTISLDLKFYLLKK